MFWVDEIAIATKKITLIDYQQQIIFLIGYVQYSMGGRARPKQYSIAFLQQIIFGYCNVQYSIAFHILPIQDFPQIRQIP